jgi:hypothetical protein
MACARPVLDRMIQATNRGERARLNVDAPFKMKDVDVVAGQDFLAPVSR